LFFNREQGREPKELFKKGRVANDVVAQNGEGGGESKKTIEERKGKG